MILLILLAALSLWGIVATVRAWRNDGYRAVPTDWARVTPASADDDR
ncbi:hypothetical protein [Microbacterium sp.]